jgi:hypothetical protein
MDWSFEP